MFGNDLRSLTLSLQLPEVQTGSKLFSGNPDRVAWTSAGVNQPKSAFLMHFAQIVGMSA